MFEMLPISMLSEFGILFWAGIGLWCALVAGTNERGNLAYHAVAGDHKNHGVSLLWKY